jgi:hypothetical protein
MAVTVEKTREFFDGCTVIIACSLPCRTYPAVQSWHGFISLLAIQVATAEQLNGAASLSELDV